MKLYKYIAAIGLIVSGAAFTSCSNDDDTYDYPGIDGQVVLALTKNDSYKMVKTPVQIIAPTLSWKTQVKTRIRATEQVVVKFEIDNSLVDAYNQENGTEYVALPAGLVELYVPELPTEDEGEAETTSRAGEPALVTIDQGNTISTTEVAARFVDNQELLASLDLETTYIVPVRMTEVVKGNAKIAVSGTNVSYLTFSLTETMICNDGSINPKGTIVPKAQRQSWTGTPGGGASEWYGWYDPICTESDYNFGNYPQGSYVVFDFGQEYTYDGVYSYPYYGQSRYALFRAGVTFYTSNDGNDWNKLGEIDAFKTTVTFYAPVTSRYLKVELGSSYGSVATTAFSIYAF